MNQISVVVCCYNSASRLPQTLKHLAKQSLNDGVSCEVIVVDNNCTDGTGEVAQREWKQLGEPFPLFVVEEKQPGLSHARKTGAEAARYQYICYCDDDNWLCEDYLQTSIQVMDSDPKIGVLAGQGIAASDVEIPNWFYSYYRSFACGVLALESGEVSDRKYVWGAGMVLRRKVYLALFEAGFSHCTLDREGTKLTSGGDNELCYWHLLVGFKLWYDERLVFNHYMPANRLTKEYLTALTEGQTESATELQLYSLLMKRKATNKTLRGFVKSIVDLTLGNRRSSAMFAYLPWFLESQARRFEKQVTANIKAFRNSLMPAHVPLGSKSRGVADVQSV